MTFHFDMTDEATFKKTISALGTLIALDALPQPESKCNSCDIKYNTALVIGQVAAMPFGEFVCGQCLGV